MFVLQNVFNTRKSENHSDKGIVNFMKTNGNEAIFCRQMWKSVFVTKQQFVSIY